MSLVPHTHLRIIVIDDDPFDAELICMSLKVSLACQVVVVSSRASFVAELERERADLIISDSNIPSFDGLAALAMVQERWPEIPFIFCSGSDASPDIERAMNAGARAWIGKNHLETLPKIVAACCGL